MTAPLSRRALLKTGGALVVGFALPVRVHAQQLHSSDRVLGRTLDTKEVDGFIAVHADGSVTLFSGKVDLGTGLRIAVRQMAAEELGLPVDRIAMIEGDTALTPDQGPTAGSSGIVRGGVQIRQAAATARAALIAMAAEKLGRAPKDLDVADGAVRPRDGGEGVGFGTLVGDRRFELKLDPRAPLKDPKTYAVVGKPLPRPDIPAKATGRHRYVHDVTLPGMMHGRVIRPASVGARLLEVDKESVAGIPGVQIVRARDFLGVVAPIEWEAERAARALKARWSDSATLVGSQGVRDWMTAGPFESDAVLVRKGAASPTGVLQLKSGPFYWPVQSHGSMGPSCAVADVRADHATVWTASQATHKFQPAFAKFLDLPEEHVRLIYLDGAGCYGMNGHDDAAADAALLSKAVGRPVRVQWSRADEHGWDPKGPPQLLSLSGAIDGDGRIVAWRTEMWLPKATARLPHVPLLAPEAAGIAQTPGLSTGLITQNGDPPYQVPNVEVTVHWLKDAPLRPSNIRAPGKIANSFAVESFTDELAHAARRDPLEFRLAQLADPRGVEVRKRAAALIGWQARPPAAPGTSRLGRGIAYVHYKHNEAYVATAMEVEVERGSGAIKVRRVACAHDCGLVINPDALRAQVEGNSLQTLSRTMFEEVAFDRSRVTSIDWASYPILTFPDVPEIAIDLVDRPTEKPLGAGEAAATPVPAALANAIFDATGARLRTVPFTPDRVKQALAHGSA
jgi:CO/xanthine dehydrogenase Mo-binding subunit